MVFFVILSMFKWIFLEKTSGFKQSVKMTGTLWMIFVLLPVCNYAAYIRCIPPNEQKIVRAMSEMRDERSVDAQMRFDEVITEKPKPSRRLQKTFIRNPNYICKIPNFMSLWKNNFKSNFF